MAEPSAPPRAVSLVLAAGKGTRMTGYQGNKTLLPLVPGERPFTGERPLILEVLENLPPGPKGLVLHHRAEDVRRATAGVPEVTYILQPQPDGTGGAVLAARGFLEGVAEERVLITMGDVPLIRPETYRALLSGLEGGAALVVLSFRPREKARYGVVETEGGLVTRITEWTCWREYPRERQEALSLCNAGVYAARRAELLPALADLAARPHTVEKLREGRMRAVREYFLTDIVEILGARGFPVVTVTADEEEVSGVDTPEALALAQERYGRLRRA